ncbi:MAG TPA: DUF5615 family PIN-like protein [Pyrinomonadaceae bacterium]|nr:DUF5615 family PIN-like protein [Pyrinomonadaceae bacterium]
MASTRWGTRFVKLRELIRPEIADEDVLRLAAEHDCVLITCNRDDFLEAAQRIPHVGLIVLIRRRSRAHERAALVGLLDKAGDAGIRNNINFA